MILYIYIYTHSCAHKFTYYKWIYKNYPVVTFTYPWILILCVVSWVIHDCFCLVIVVHESLVCLEQLNCLLFRKILLLLHILCFPASSAYVNSFQQWLYDFEIHLFHRRTTEGMIHNYYKRWKYLLMLEKATQGIKSQRVYTFELDDDV